MAEEATFDRLGAFAGMCGDDFLASLARSCMTQAALALVYVDQEGLCVHANDWYLRLMGLPATAVIGRRLADLVETGVAVAAQMSALAEAGRGGGSAPVVSLVERDGGRKALVSGCFIAHAAGDTAGYLGLLHEAPNDQCVRDFLLRKESFVAAIMDAALDGIIAIDRGGIIRTANRAACTLFGYEAADLLGNCVTMLMPAPAARDHGLSMADHLESERARIIGKSRDTLGRRKDGTVIPVNLSIGKARLGDERVFVGIIRDISERLAAEQQARFLARHDPLTGVYTRSAFLEECETFMAAADDGCIALFSLDIDQFSDINEAYGFHVGDAALKAMVARIADVLPPETHVCRIAADEFAALTRVADAEDAHTLADRLHDRLAASIYLDRNWLRLRVSIGVAVTDGHAQRFEDLNTKGKLALQAAQHNGGNAVCFYTPEMAAAATRRMLLTLHLAHAVERNELRLVFQPIVAAASGTVACAEALLRWNHAALGAISPAEFIPVAEESGVIVPITDWVLTTVVDQLLEWHRQGVMPGRVFVNISGLQFQHGNLTERLEELLAPHPPLRGRLGLEITEQAAVHDLKVAIRTLRDLADIGVQTAIDDFGSGYSSLSYVQQLPVAKLKIDRAFIIDIPRNVRNAALVRAAVGMAHGLGLVVVAEGVETIEQQEYLLSVGCDLLQGYLFGRPMPPEDFAALMRRQKVALPSEVVGLRA